MKNTIKKLVYFTLALSSLIAISLAIHLYDVMGAESKKGNIQIARIDVKENFGEKEAGEIRNALDQIDGVQYSFLNSESKRLIFSYNPKTHHSEDIFSAFSEKVTYRTELYRPSAELASSGCPVNANEGIVGQISSLFN